LVLAGSTGWGGEDLPALAHALNIQEAVRFTGYIGEAEKSALLREAFAYVAPSLCEGFGLTVLEAQSVGTPVLCSNTSSLPEVAGHGALLFDPSDERGIAAALQRSLLDKTLRAGLIPSGYANVGRFSWQASAQKVLSVLEDIALAQPPRPPGSFIDMWL
jgi:glycosyltransferase involved in cell wall biosynthesis